MILQPGYFEHWKTRMLVELLDGDELGTICPLRLWEHCQVSGRWGFKASEMADVKLRAICRWKGKTGLLDSMKQAGFIDEDESGNLLVHDWAEHNSGLIAAKENGKSGGRPRKTQAKPKHNPLDTHGIPRDNPRDTHGIPTDNPRVTQTKPKHNPDETDRLDRVDRQDGVDGDCASASAFAGWISAFRDAHEQCRDIDDYAIADVIRTALAENPKCDVDEAISAFSIAWCGSSFSGFVTPMKELPKFLRGRNPNFQKKNGGVPSGDQDNGLEKRAMDPKKRRAVLSGGAK